MAQITGVVVSPIQGKTGTLNMSSDYVYRDFWYTDANGNRVHVVGWHYGVDITTLGTIVALEKGKVISVTKGITGQTTNPSSGNQVTLQHKDSGETTFYCHLDNGSNNHINNGMVVEKGAVLGTDTKKTTGNSTGLHLHLGIKQGGSWIDPKPVLKGQKVLTPYGGTPAPTPPQPGPSGKFNIGDKVIINGPLYVSSNAASAAGNVSNKETNITRRADGSAHPYNTTGDLGWMDESSIRLVEQPAPTPPAPQPIAIATGDSVIVNGRGTGDSYGGGAQTRSYAEQVMKVVYVKDDGRPRPYALNQNNNMNGVTGWFAKDQIRKA